MGVREGWNIIHGIFSLDVPSYKDKWDGEYWVWCSKKILKYKEMD
jgi:hypothetical protein